MEYRDSGLGFRVSIGKIGIRFWGIEAYRGIEIRV